MKCARCYALNVAGDTVCIGCGSALARGGMTFGSGVGAGPATPTWAYLFAGLCGLIPIVTLGGCVPAMIGLGGPGMCLQLARSTSVPAVLRVLGCIFVTLGCWIVLGVFLVALAQTLKQ